MRGLSIAVVLGQSCRKIADAVVRRGAAYTFPLLCDEGRAVIKQYGVWHPLGLDTFNTAHPASFLIDSRERRVRYAFVGRAQFARAPLDAIIAATEGS